MKFEQLYNLAYKEKYCKTKGVVTFLKYGKQLCEIITSFENSSAKEFKNFNNINDIQEAIYWILYEIFKSRGNQKSTIQRKFSTLAGILTFAYEKNLLEHKVKYLDLKAKSQERAYFLLQDEIKLLDYYYNNDEKMYAFWFLACNIGLRPINLLALNDKNIIREEMVFDDTKNNEIVKIPIIEDFEPILTMLQTNNYFANYTYHKIYFNFIRVRNALKLDKNYTPYSARHAFATNLFSLGVNVDIVKRLLGHKINYGATNNYNHYDYKKEKVEALNLLINLKEEEMKKYYKLINSKIA